MSTKDHPSKIYIEVLSEAVNRYRDEAAGDPENLKSLPHTASQIERVSAILQLMGQLDIGSISAASLAVQDPNLGSRKDNNGTSEG